MHWLSARRARPQPGVAVERGPLTGPGGDHARVAQLLRGCPASWWLRRSPQKESWEGGKGVAAQSISPRPLARAREI